MAFDVAVTELHLMHLMHLLIFKLIIGKKRGVFFSPIQMFNSNGDGDIINGTTSDL